MATAQLSKTQAIRKALKKNGSPKQVAAELNKQGIKVSPQYVSTIKFADKQRASTGAPARKPGRPPASAKKAAVTSDLKEASELLSCAVELVLACGASQARELVAMADAMIHKVR